MATETLDRQIIRTVPQFFFIWDLKKRQIIHFAQGVRGLVQEDATKVSAYEKLLDFVHVKDHGKFEEILQSLSPQQAHQDHDLRVNQERYPGQWFNLRTFPAEDQHGQVTRIIAHISDVTKRKAELSALERLNEENESVIRILAHDLKNPINTVMVLAEVAEREIREGDQEKGFAMLRMISESGRTMRTMVESMLELLELTDSHLSLEMHQTDVVALLDTVLDSMAFQFERHHIRLTRRWPKEPVITCLDAQRFPHVISNLLSNALKFTSEGGEVVVTVSDRKRHIAISVSDTGVGIPTDQQPNVFKEFFKARKKGLRGEKSSGLGLSIVKKIVELHQGTTTVQSTLGIGTTFLVKIPRR